MGKGNAREGSVHFEAYGIDNVIVKGIDLASSFFRKTEVER
jgi:hypothetical protein